MTSTRFLKFATAGSGERLPFVASTHGLDRQNDHINQSGWRLAGYQKNPVLLWSHDSERPPIGRVERLRVEAGALRGEAVLDTADPFAADLARKLKDGFLAAFSVGFLPLKARPNKAGGLDYIESELLEISLVSVPANTDARIARGHTMNVIENLRSERHDVVEKMAALSGLDAMSDSDHDDFDALQKQVAELDHRIAKMTAESLRKAEKAVPCHVDPMDLPPPDPAPVKSEYLLSRLLKSVANHEDCPEIDWSRHMSTLHGSAKGVYLPFAIEKSSVVGTLSNAGALVSAYAGSLIERLIAPSLLSRLPIQKMTMPKGSGELVLPRLGTGTSAGWFSETATATESEPSFGKITLSPRRCVVYCRFSRMLLASSSPSIDAVLTADMSTALSEAIDTALLNGSGNQQPTGIVSQATALSEGSYANLFDALTACVKSLEDANVTGDGIAWLASPAALKRLRTSFIADAADATDGSPILSPGAGLLGFPVVSSTFLTGSTLLLCRWSDIIAATWSPGLDAIVDPFSQAEQGLIRLISELYIDFGIRHSESLIKLSLTS